MQSIERQTKQLTEWETKITLPIHQKAIQPQALNTQEIGSSFLADCKLRELSPKTLKGYIFHIKQLTQASPEFPPEPDVVQHLLANVKGGKHNADSHYRTFHALGSYAKKRYKIPKRLPNFMQGVTRPRVLRQIMPTLSNDELIRLATLLKEASPRNKAVVTLLVDTAIRSGEACNLKRKDILEDRIVVHGKSGYRVAPLSPFTRELLLALPVHEDGYIFHGTNKNKNKPLGSTGFYKIVRKCLRAIGYEGKQASPQILRRSFGRFWLLSGGDMKSLSLLLGHKSIKTTDDYYTPLLDEDVIAIHHKHTPGRVFENAIERRV